MNAVGAKISEVLSLGKTVDDPVLLSQYQAELERHKAELIRLQSESESASKAAMEKWLPRAETERQQKWRSAETVSVPPDTQAARSALVEDMFAGTKEQLANTHSSSQQLKSGKRAAFGDGLEQNENSGPVAGNNIDEL